MSTRFALSAIGQDQPGIVAAISEVLFEHGCNIEDSAMTILRGQFAMILVVTPPLHGLQENLRKHLEAVCQRQEMRLSLNPLSEPPALASDRATQAYRVSVYGADHPGIVAQTTAFLAQRKINILDLTTRVVEGDGPIYIMVLEIEAPAGIEEDQLRQELEELKGELKVDLSLQKVETEIL